MGGASLADRTLCRGVMEDATCDYTYNWRTSGFDILGTISGKVSNCLLK